MFPSQEETALWIALNLAQRSAYGAMDAALKAKRLPPLRWYDVLWSIERARGEGLRPFEIERSLLFEQSNLSRLLSRMIGEGLVEESVFQDDRRGKILRITGKGRRVRKQMWQIYGPLLHRHMSGLSSAYDLEDITSAINSLIERQE